MIVTTTPTIEGHTIKEYKGVVSGEVIFGMNFLKDFGASLRDFFGGRTDSYEKAMLEGRETAQREMRERAVEMEATPIFAPTTEPWGQHTCYVADPEGNLIEISSFNPE